MCVLHTYTFDCESRNRASRSRAPILLKYYCRLLGANFSEGHGILSTLHEQIERARSIRVLRGASSFQTAFLDIVTRVSLPLSLSLSLSPFFHHHGIKADTDDRINRSYVFPRRFDLLFSSGLDRGRCAIRVSIHWISDS